ncbi:MAG: hypothetical protein GEV08_12530 [Acidimicrobiia bacterium]|nr:hypothetical protein [Acidimicrobiia bacterium]
MQLTRFSPGEDGGSRFSQVEVSFPHERVVEPGREIRSSSVFPSGQVQFAVLPDGLDQPLHPAPRRQLVVVLAGRVDVGTPDGQRRQFGAGEVFLADDVHSPGHTTRTVDGPVHVLFVPIADDQVF